MEKWKAEVRFPLSHNPGCCYEYGFVCIARIPGAKAPFLLKAAFDTSKAVSFQKLRLDDGTTC
jgi:hypothetical protein